MRKYSIITILIFQATFSFACLNTYQFKIFPIGVYQDTIVTVDVQILRTSQVEGSRLLKLEPGQRDEDGEMWILYSFVSMYTKDQKLISLTPLDTVHSIGTTYLDTLDKSYQYGLNKIADGFSNLEYFKPEYISFCDFQQTCNLVALHSDTVQNEEYFMYAGKRYNPDLLKDTSYFGFGGLSADPEARRGLSINSIRIYKTQTVTLLVTHLATGHEIAMGLIKEAKEHKPSFAFSDLKKSTYKEPLLYHGYGFDLFIVQ